MNNQEFIMTMIKNGRKALERFETYDQAHVDCVVKAVGKSIYDHGEELACLAVEETGMGSYESKVRKNKNKAIQMWHYLQGKKSVGVLEEEEAIIKIAKPVGIVGCITPVTNPIITPLHNAMIALKGRNVIIIAPHPKSKRAVTKAVFYMNSYLQEIGAPEHLVQVIEEPSLEVTTLLLQTVDVNIATGGPSMVEAVYRSGKPSFGVGAGNNQCLVADDADLALSVPLIIASRMNDNGILCTGEQTLICMKAIYQKTIAAFQEAGCYYIEEARVVENARNLLFPNGNINKELVGQSPVVIAKALGLSIPKETKLLILKSDAFGLCDVLSKEKLFPVMISYAVPTWEEAINIAKKNLEVQGIGHSICLHTFDRIKSVYAAEQINVGRVLVNGNGSAGLGGAYNNKLIPTATLGCGSWGNNSLSNNLDYTDLLNITRLAFSQREFKAPDPIHVWDD